MNPLGLSWRGFDLAETTEGKVIGCAQVKDHRDGTRELASLWVHPDYRGQGVASMLVRLIQGRADADLWLTCRADLVPLYLRYNFLEVDQPALMPGYFQRVWWAFRWMQKLGIINEHLAVMRWTRI